MDSADLFRHLLTTKTIPEKTRTDYEFGFRTVFYIHGSSYCCCRCAYDHEYFTYISNTGEIDKDNFDKLAKAVECGYCEHAIPVHNKDYLKETKVYATHVLAALGSEDMVEVASVLDGNGLPKQNSLPPNRNRYRRDYRRTNAKDTSIKHTGLFELTPCDIGFLKHNGKALHLVDSDEKITCAEEIANNVLHFDKISRLQFCSKTQFIEDPRTVLDAVYADGIKYYELLFKFGLGAKLYEIIETLELELIANKENRREDLLLDSPYCKEQFDRSVEYKVRKGLTAIGELSVIYNQYYIPRRWNCSEAIAILNRAIVPLQGLKFKESLELPSTHATVYPYTYDRQNSELEIPLRPDTHDRQTSELEILLRLLVKYELSRDQVRMAMEQIPDLQDIINKRIINKRNNEGLTLLQSYICEEWCVEVPVVRTLIELGANIDMPLESGQSLLTIILNKIHMQGFREVLELLLYENISPSEYGSEVLTAIHLYNMNDAEKQDTSDLFSMLYMNMRISGDVKMPQSDHFLEPGTYVMDATLHNDVFACTLPLLIEAGFKYSSSALRDLVESFEDCSAPDNSQTSSAESSEAIHVRRAPRALCSHEELSINPEHVMEYLDRYSTEPRPLMLRCRDVLRTRFPRRQIHRYVSVMNIPERIGDFLLLKSILRRLPLDI